MVNNPVFKGRIVFFGLLFVYLISHILMLLSNGVWWDDNLLWNVTPQMLYNYLGPGDANEPLQYAYIKWVTDTYPLTMQVYVFHIVAFLIHGLSLTCCWFILKTLTEDKEFTTMCSLLIAAFGFDTTSMLIVCTHYTVANCLFLLGLLACIKEYKSGKAYHLYIAGIAWLFSLIMWRSAALLMPFCLLVLSCAKYKSELRTFQGWRNVVRHTLVHYWPIIVPVLLFVPYYVYFLRPSGSHAVYYKPEMSNILTSPFTALISAIIAIFAVIGGCLNSLFDAYNLLIMCLTLILVGAVYVCVRHLKVQQSEEKQYNSMATIAFLYLIVSMILPLFIDDFLEVLNISEYKSRMLSLGALPISIIIVYGLYYLSPRVRYIAFSLLLTGSILYTIYTDVNYAYAWRKAEIITEYFKNNPELEGTNILMIDYAFAANENNSCMRYYSYEGMARMAYGADTKTRINPKYSEYYSKSFKPNYIVRCSASYLPITKKEKCKLVFSKWLFKRKYQRLSKEMLQIEHEGVNVE